MFALPTLARSAAVALLFALQLLLPRLAAAQPRTIRMDAAQEKPTDEYRAFDFSLDIKNMHLWRGYQVTPGAMTGTSVYYNNRAKTLKTGFWGGAGFTGAYREVCFFLHYQPKNTFVDVLNSFNFSSYITSNIFSYDPSTSPHYIDVTVGHRFEPLHLVASLSTVVQGRDVYYTESGQRRNRFSHYAELRGTAWQQADTNLKFFVGGGFSFMDKSNFYGSRPNLVNVGLELNRTVTLFDYRLPLAATFRVNPEQESGALEFAAHVF